MLCAAQGPGVDDDRKVSIAYLPVLSGPHWCLRSAVTHGYEDERMIASFTAVIDSVEWAN